MSQEVIQVAEATDIVDFCAENNYVLERLTEKYYRGVDHDSLIIDRKKNRFQWYSTGKYGNSIDFVRTFFDKDFREAVEMLTEKEYKHTKEIPVKPRKEFVYDIAHDQTTEQAEKYLVEQRGIDQEIVHALISKGLLKQDVRKNCVFVWGETGKAVGADLQGTVQMTKNGKRTTFKQIRANSKQHYGFNISLGLPRKLYFFESPIDLLSYWSMNKELTNCRLVSMNGLKEKTIMNMINHTFRSRGVLPTEGVFIGVDNDRAGQKFMDKVKHYRFATKDEKEVAFHNLIAGDQHIPRAYIEMYETTANKYNIDWKHIAAIHKTETNLGNTNEITNNYEYGKFFGRELLPGEFPQKVPLSTAIEECARELARNKVNGRVDLRSVLKVNGFPHSKQFNIEQKTLQYYENYSNLGYLPVEQLSKDWNDLLQIRVGSSKKNEKYHHKQKSKERVLLRG
ncbi:DUF3991 domain-containing protein [Bacillus swezeyi]|uniref:DUF3991 domain-containing protein n=1 Tax=Bacillus swezeyi TaxID=1925020 RepID=UPI002E214E88|nr:DUF3991 domain-containing protein [Bacillus swezeyi]